MTICEPAAAVSDGRLCRPRHWSARSSARARRPRAGEAYSAATTAILVDVVVRDKPAGRSPI